eukprot:2006543-Pyramimonas_sp.AAC.1
MCANSFGQLELAQALPNPGVAACPGLLDVGAHRSCGCSFRKPQAFDMRPRPGLATLGDEADGETDGDSADGIAYLAPPRTRQPLASPPIRLPGTNAGRQTGARSQFLWPAL